MEINRGIAKTGFGILLAGILLTAGMLFLSDGDGMNGPTGSAVSSASNDNVQPGQSKPFLLSRVKVFKPAGSDESDAMLPYPNEGHSVYSDSRIHRLNRLLPIPDNEDAAQKEADRLAVQLRRFENLYGPESVAVRSIRLRLDELDDYAGQNVQYAVAGDEAPRGDGGCAKYKAASDRSCQ